LENRRIEATQTQLLLTPPPTGVLRPGGLMPEMEAGDEGLGSRRGHPQIPAGVYRLLPDTGHQHAGGTLPARFGKEREIYFPGSNLLAEKLNGITEQLEKLDG